jgi:hypothetical protein
MIDRLRAAVIAARESFGADDHRTLAARLALGRGFRDRTRDEEAYVELVALADDCARVLGPDHPDTLIARHEAGLSCLHLHMLQVDPDPARLPEAIRRLEEVAAVRERLYGSSHPDTLGVWLNLAYAYGNAQRIAESNALDERILAGWKKVVADRERELGPDAPDTQFARLSLAGRMGWEASRVLRQQVAASWGRLAAERSATLGPVHPDTIDAREHHAYSHRGIDQDDDVRLIEEIAADLLDALGPADPHTLHAQVQLASRYFEGNYDQAGAIDLGERIIDDVRRVLGPEHEDLRLVRAMLMVAYQAGGRTEKAIAVAARYPMPDDKDDLN